MEVVCPWVIPTPELRRVAQKYRVPLHVLASIRGLKPEKLAEAYKAAHQKEYFDLLATAKSELLLIGRPVGFAAKRVTAKDGDKVLLTLSFNTVRVEWWLTPQEFEKRTVEEWYRVLTDWTLVKARRVVRTRKTRSGEQKVTAWVAEKVIFAKSEEDVDTARWLVERYRNAGLMHPILAAFGALLGFAPRSVEDDARLGILILLYALPVAAAEPIHMVMFTRPGVGKTTTALIYRDILKWEYYAEVPSVASLVGDARTGRSRIAGAQGVWFDEVDKWVARSAKRDAVADVVEVLLTGMEQGYWKRSRGGEKTIEVHNAIPVVFTGNTAEAAEPRSKLMSIIAKATADAAEALDQRIAVAVTIASDWSDVVMSNTLEAKTGRPWLPRPSVLRGMRTLLNDWYLSVAEPSDTGGFKGRRARAFKRVTKAIRVLLAKKPGEWLDEGVAAEIAKKLIQGYIFTDNNIISEA